MTKGEARSGSRVVTIRQVLDFRLATQHLAAPLPPGSLLEAAGACGVQDTPPGSAALALHARVQDLTPEDLRRAVEEEKSLLRAWSLRGAPYLFPTSDAPVFTLGVLPEDEESLRTFIWGVVPALEQVGISASELVEWTALALEEVLDRRELTKDQLGVELAQRLETRLKPSQLAPWRSNSAYAAGQSQGESMVRFALYVVPLYGLLCFGPRRGRTATLLRTDQWLGSPLPQAGRDEAQAELLRRYLRCYGPSTPDHFAKWTGISLSQATRTWNRIEAELVSVRIDGRECWLREEDLPLLEDPPPASGVRFLPPHDPYLQLRDRESLIPDTALQRRLWRTVGNPGVLLVDGRAVAMWRPRKQGKKLRILVERFDNTPRYDSAPVEAEAERLAPFRGCSSVEVQFL